MKANLMNFINQMSMQDTSYQVRKELENLKQLMPLYDKHDFWDTQPVQTNYKEGQKVSEILKYKIKRLMNSKVIINSYDFL